MKEQVKRVTLAGSVFEAVEFDTVCGKWLVKNFTDNDIYVSFASDATTNNSIKIPKDYAQVCIANEFVVKSDAFKADTIYVYGTGEVEVQQLCFH